MTNTATDRLKRELDAILDSMRNDLDRVELLVTALSVFSRPVPDYEPRFHHLHRAAWNAQELGQAANHKQ
jgi:hypothetical protein